MPVAEPSCKNYETQHKGSHHNLLALTAGFTSGVNRLEHRRRIAGGAVAQQVQHLGERQAALAPPAALAEGPNDGFVAAGHRCSPSECTRKPRSEQLGALRRIAAQHARGDAGAEFLDRLPGLDLLGQGLCRRRVTAAEVLAVKVVQLDVAGVYGRLGHRSGQPGGGRQQCAAGTLEVRGILLHERGDLAVLHHVGLVGELLDLVELLQKCLLAAAGRLSVHHPVHGKQISQARLDARAADRGVGSAIGPPR
mmetsp:Transcript_26888/g.89244  ORF Transcript_26888/g.89244 Transcript_26888/m.89244 type:complete len:252 (+) Transcript_26888:143-898(+)